MVVTIPSKEDQALEAQRMKELPKVIRSIKIAEKLQLAKKERRSEYAQNRRLRLRLTENNYDNQIIVNQIVFEKVQTLYAYIRSQIQNPTTPRSQKIAYKKIARIIEYQFGIEKLSTSQHFRKVKIEPYHKQRKPEAYSFCYVKPKV